MADVVEAAATALVNQFPRLQEMTGAEKHARFKLIVEAALLAFAESRRAAFSTN